VTSSVDDDITSQLGDMPEYTTWCEIVINSSCPVILLPHTCNRGLQLPVNGADLEWGELHMLQTVQHMIPALKYHSCSSFSRPNRELHKGLCFLQPQFLPIFTLTHKVIFPLCYKAWLQFYYVDTAILVLFSKIKTKQIEIERTKLIQINSLFHLPVHCTWNCFWVKVETFRTNYRGTVIPNFFPQKVVQAALWYFVTSLRGLHLWLSVVPDPLQVNPSGNIAFLCCSRFLNHQILV
jgi:hypothetical protein